MTELIKRKMPYLILIISAINLLLIFIIPTGFERDARYWIENTNFSQLSQNPIIIKFLEFVDSYNSYGVKITILLFIITIYLFFKRRNTYSKPEKTALYISILFLIVIIILVFMLLIYMLLLGLSGGD